MVTLVFTMSFSVVLAAFSKLRGNAEKYIVFVFFVVMFLIAGFRNGEKLFDYTTYVKYYNVNATYVELSFQFISFIIHKFFDNVIWLFVIYAILGVSIKIVAIRQLSDFVFFSILIYISNFYLLHEFTQIRVGVAAGFILLCIKQIYNRNIVKFFLFGGLGIFFHASAVIVIPLWFLRRDKINRYFYMLLIPFSMVLYILNINILATINFLPQKYYLFQKIVFYSKKTETVNIFNYVFLVKCAVYYLLLWKVWLIAKHNQFGILLIKIHGIALASFILFSSIPTIAFRIRELLEIVEIITIPMLLYSFKPLVVVKFCILFFAFAMLCINIFYNKLLPVYLM